MATDSVAAPTFSPAPGRRTHYWQLPAFLAGVAAVALATAKFPVAPDSPAARHQRNVKALRLALEAKPLDAPAAESLAATVAGDPAADAEARLLAGTALVAVAEHAPAGPDGPQVADAWRRAAAQLSAVEAGGLAGPDDRKRLAFRLAKAQAALAAGDAKLLALTLADVPPGDDIEGERRRLLAECYLRQVPPDYPHAREELQAYLSSSLRLSPAPAARAREKLAGVHVALGDNVKARACLKEIGATAPAEVQALAKSQLGRLAAAENRFGEAVTYFEAALANPALTADHREGLCHDIARAHLGAKNPAAAVPYLEEATRGTGTGPDAARAGVMLAQVLLADPARRGRRAAAIDALAVAAKSTSLAGFADGPHSGMNPSLLTDARAAFEQAVATCLSEGDFASAVRAATEYSPVAPPGRATEKRAEANAAWGASLKGDPATLPAATTKLAEAAADFAALAATFPNPAGKADLLKRAAQCFRAAGDDKAAAALIDRLTQTPGVSDDVVATAWVEKADALLAGSQFDDGVKALRQAMLRPSPAAATARVRLAVAHLDQARLKSRAAETDAARQEVQGLMQSAKDLLAAAINAPGDTATEKEAQQSALFEMGKLHVNQMDLVEAETRFRQLLQSHPDGPQAGSAKLYLASCLLLMARGDHQGGRPPADADAKLAEARKVFEALSESQDPFLSTQADIRLANTMLLLRKYDEMPSLCEKLAKRYEGKLEELIIRSMLYTAYRFADRTESAAAVRVQMTDLFQKLPDSQFPGGDREEYTREYWQRVWFTPLKAK